MPNLGPTELLIIALLIMLLFGAKKMPDAARSLGRSMRIFKAETKGMRGEDEDDSPQQAAQQEQQPAQQQPAQQQSSQQQSSQQQQLPPGSDGTVVNGQPVNETERSPESR